MAEVSVLSADAERGTGSLNPAPRAAWPRPAAGHAQKGATTAYARQLIEFGLKRGARPVVTTNFRPGAAALLHLLVQRIPDIPVIWVDTGYNTPATYRYVDELSADLGLNVKAYTPRWSAARLAAVDGEHPAPGSRAFETFVERVKLEPFQRAFAELAPDVWFTGIRQGQSEFRDALGPVSSGHRGTLRVAPVYYWSTATVEDYLDEHGIANHDDYVDITKPDAHLECGLQTLA